LCSRLAHALRFLQRRAHDGGSVWETERVGNGHISSFRAATTHIWAHQHLGELFVGGMLLFWLVALMSARFSRPSRV